MECTLTAPAPVRTILSSKVLFLAVKPELGLLKSFRAPDADGNTLIRMEACALEVSVFVKVAVMIVVPRPLTDKAPAASTLITASSPEV